MNSADLVKMLKDAGFKEIRVKGSHHHFKKDGHPNIVTVPHPKKDLPEGTVKGILKAAGLKSKK